VLGFVGLCVLLQGFVDRPARRRYSGRMRENLTPATETVTCNNEGWLGLAVTARCDDWCLDPRSGVPGPYGPGPGGEPDPLALEPCADRPEASDPRALAGALALRSLVRALQLLSTRVRAEPPAPVRRRRRPKPVCADCGARGEIMGHQDCRYPGAAGCP
jgi:hypothetical protein